MLFCICNSEMCSELRIMEPVFLLLWYFCCQKALSYFPFLRLSRLIFKIKCMLEVYFSAQLSQNFSHIS